MKAEEVEYRGMLLEPWYHLRITNLETYSMFSNMFKGWFDDSMSNYNEFIEALLKGNLKEMNIYMNDIALTTSAVLIPEIIHRKEHSQSVFIMDLYWDFWWNCGIPMMCGQTGKAVTADMISCWFLMTGKKMRS